MTTNHARDQASQTPDNELERPTVESMLGLGALALRIGEARLWLTLGLISLGLSVGGYKIGNRYGLVIGFFLALALDALIFFYDEWRLLNQFPSAEIEGADAWGLNAVTRGLAKRLGHPQPTLREIESETPFVFSAGYFPSRLKIFVSSALARKLAPDELSAVLGYELERSRRGATRTATATVAFADLILLVLGTLDAALGLRFLLRRRLRRTFFGPFTWLGMPFIALFLRLVIGRSTALATDQKTAATFGNPEALARALTKLDSYAKTLPLDVSLAEAALFTVDPLSHFDFSSWTTATPTLESRVRKLTGRFPV